MSIQQVITVRDSAVGAYNRPFIVPSIGAGIRSFGDEVQRVDTNNQMNSHPQDFELYHVGTFDEQTGLITSFDQPILIARAIDYIVRA